MQRRQPNFNRGGVRAPRQYLQSTAGLPGRHESNPTIRTELRTSVDYYDSASSGSIETPLQDATGGLRFQNNGSTELHRDRVRSPRCAMSSARRRHPDVYSTESYANANIGNSRKITGTAPSPGVGSGTGTTRASAAPSDGGRCTSAWTDVRRNDVTLPEGAFMTKRSAQVSLCIYATGLLQRVSAVRRHARQVGSISFRWTYRPLRRPVRVV